MIGGILLLGIAVFGLMVLFGKAKADNYYQLLIWLILAPILLSIGYNHALWFWLGLPLWMQILSFLLIPFAVSPVLRILFPNAKWIQNFQTVIFQSFVYGITFPFRFLWRAGQFFFQHERPRQRLNPNRPVVGTRPPLENGRREVNPRGNIFD